MKNLSHQVLSAEALPSLGRYNNVNIKFYFTKLTKK